MIDKDFELEIIKNNKLHSTELPKPMYYEKREIGIVPIYSDYYPWYPIGYLKHGLN